MLPRNSDGELVRKAVKFLQEGSGTVLANFSGWGKDNKVAVPLFAETSPKQKIMKRPGFLLPASA